MRGVCYPRSIRRSTDVRQISISCPGLSRHSAVVRANAIHSGPGARPAHPDRSAARDHGERSGSRAQINPSDVRRCQRCSPSNRHLARDLQRPVPVLPVHLCGGYTHVPFRLFRERTVRSRHGLRRRTLRRPNAAVQQRWALLRQSARHGQVRSLQLQRCVGYMQSRLPDERRLHRRHCLRDRRASLRDALGGCAAERRHVRQSRGGLCQPTLPAVPAKSPAARTPPSSPSPAC